MVEDILQNKVTPQDCKHIKVGVQCVNMMNICKLEVSKVDMGSGCEGESQRGKKRTWGGKVQV